MDLETKLSNWFEEIDTDSFDVVSHYKKLEDVLNDTTTSSIYSCDETSNNSHKGCHKTTCNFVTTFSQHIQILNFCDIFDVCVMIPVIKVDIRNEIEYFCKIVELLIRTEYFDVTLVSQWDLLQPCIERV